MDPVTFILVELRHWNWLPSEPDEKVFGSVNEFRSENMLI